MKYLNRIKISSKTIFCCWVKFCHDFDSEKTTEPVTKEDKKTEPELLTRDDNWRHTAPVREWDKGKESKHFFKHASANKLFG